MHVITTHIHYYSVNNNVQGDSPTMLDSTFSPEIGSEFIHTYIVISGAFKRSTPEDRIFNYLDRRFITSAAVQGKYVLWR